MPPPLNTQPEPDWPDPCPLCRGTGRRPSGDIWNRGGDLPCDRCRGTGRKSLLVQQETP